MIEVTAEEQTEELHRHIGALISENVKYPGKSIVGSGILISPNIVLTVAHNVWCRNFANKNINIRFYPGQRGFLKNPYECEIIYYPKDYESKHQPAQFDYALLKLVKAK